MAGEGECRTLDWKAWRASFLIRTLKQLYRERETGGKDPSETLAKHVPSLSDAPSRWLFLQCLKSIESVRKGSNFIHQSFQKLLIR